MKYAIFGVFAILILSVFDSLAQNYFCTKRDGMSGSFSLSCEAAQPIPRPSQPSQPSQPPPTISANCRSGGDMGPTGARHYHCGTIGQPYAYSLPKGNGQLTGGDDPQSPDGLTIELAISRYPGDFTYYKSAQASITSSRGSVNYPCGGVFGKNGAHIQWGFAGDGETCKIDGGQWYLNVRYVGGCPAGQSCVWIYGRHAW